MIFRFSFLFIFCIFAAHATENKIDYWNVQRKGANYFNQTPSADWFTAAREAGIQFARLTPDKWACEKRDFLIGNADSFSEISGRDLETLKDILDQAQKNDVKVVLTLLSLPGSRWSQNNQDEDDLRIWVQGKFRKQAILFWKNLAEALKDHPAIVGYNILNEPHPERLFAISDFRQINFQQWHESIKGSFADLNRFYRDIINAIRAVDLSTPIIIDTGLHATPWAISYLTPIEDEKVIYSFHMYEPYAYTTRKINQGRFTFPGTVPLLLEDSMTPQTPVIHWDSQTLEDFFLPVSSWQKQYQIPASRILVGEFGCDRMSKGAELYLSNLIRIFNANQWHWAFYAFREDCWDSMDYELGPDLLEWKYWDAIEQGVDLNIFRKDNPLFDVIKNDLKK